MTLALLLTKEDIQTTVRGNHIEVKTNEGVIINFTLDAAKELIEDFETIIPIVESGMRINE